jgi:predicted nucleic acid-binding protein
MGASRFLRKCPSITLDRQACTPSGQRPRAGGNGHRRPIPDLIIAATAEVHGAEVLHVDSDYDMIARVTDQPMRRLFDPGPT